MKPYVQADCKSDQTKYLDCFVPRNDAKRRQDLQRFVPTRFGAWQRNRLATLLGKNSFAGL